MVTFGWALQLSFIHKKCSINNFIERLIKHELPMDVGKFFLFFK